MRIEGKGIHTNCRCKCDKVCNSQQTTTMTTNMCTTNSCIFSSFIIVQSQKHQLGMQDVICYMDVGIVGQFFLMIYPKEVQCQSLESWKTIAYKIGSFLKGKIVPLKLASSVERSLFKVLSQECQSMALHRFYYPSLTICFTLPKCYQMLWNFFTTSHGKGEKDGVRTLFKCKV